MRQDWRFWQYSDRGKGFGCSGSSVDLNVYNGTVEDLQTWIANSHWKICPTCNGSGKVPA
jgi:GH25 family lysozyme M1 (1,4-beta-N-acetylmuramidase)